MKEENIERLIGRIEDDILAGNDFDGNEDSLRNVILNNIQKAKVWGVTVYAKKYRYKGEELLKVEVTPGQVKDWDTYILHDNGVIDYTERN